MNRKEKRELRKDKNLIKEIYSIIDKYLPDLLNRFSKLTDIRNQSYVTYSMKVICVTRLFGLLCGLTSMTAISDKINSEEAIKNLLNVFKYIVELGKKRWKIENEEFYTQKHRTFDITHLNSRNDNAMKCHYFFIQFAHTIR